VTRLSLNLNPRSKKSLILAMTTKDVLRRMITGNHVLKMETRITTTQKIMVIRITETVTVSQTLNLMPLLKVKVS
jgi:hypothetical protein